MLALIEITIIGVTRSMVFVQFPEDSEELSLATFKGPMTFLQGKRERVLAIPDEALFELDEAEADYQIVQESDLENLLTPKGFGYYRNLKASRPDLLYWDAPLPPVKHIEVSFPVQEFRSSEAVRLVEGMGGSEIRESDLHMLQVMSANLSKSEETESVIEIRAFLPACEFHSLVRELAEAKLSGFDRAHQVMVKDPDRLLSESE